MKYAQRNWRVVAHYRGLSMLQTRREFRQALLLQMTPAELAAYKRKHLGLIIKVAIVAGVVACWVPSPGVWWIWYVLWILYNVRYYQRIDPVTIAICEYNRGLDAVVQQTCAAARQQRTNAGL
jgi:hypothetical protein